MRKGCNGGKKNGEKKREKKKRQMKIVATTSLPAVDCLNADRWKAARSCQHGAATRKLTGSGGQTAGDPPRDCR